MSVLWYPDREDGERTRLYRHAVANLRSCQPSHFETDLLAGLAPRCPAPLHLRIDRSIARVKFPSEKLHLW